MKTQPPDFKTAYTSFGQLEEVAGKRIFGPNEVNMKNARMEEFLWLCQDVSGRTVVASAPLPQASVTVQNATLSTRIQPSQLSDTVLAQTGVAIVCPGENTVKAVLATQAAREAGPVIDLPAERLPEPSNYMGRFVTLKNHKPREVMPMIQPFARVPAGIIVLESERLLVLRDFSSNIRRMLIVNDGVEAGASSRQ